MSEHERRIAQAIEEFFNRLSDALPMGCTVRVEIGQGEGSVCLIDNEGEIVFQPNLSEGTMGDSINECRDEAIRLGGE